MWFNKSSRQRSPNSLHNPHHSDSDISSTALVRLALTTRLHETLAQDLALVGYNIDEMIADPELSPGQRARLRDIRLSLVDITQQFRDTIYLAGPRDRSTMARELQMILKEIRCDIDLTYPPLRENAEALLNDALIEIARNAARHSGAQTFRISHQDSDQGFTLMISDDGRGIANISNMNIGMRVIDRALRTLSHDYTCSTSDAGTVFTVFISQAFIDLGDRT